MIDPPRPPQSTRAWSWAGVLLLLVVAVAWWTALTTPFLARALGLGPGGAFLDLQGILAANEALARGMDPYVPNPLDVSQRPFLYSTWWLWPGLGLTRAGTGWLGFGLVGATLATAFLMWRPLTGRQAIVGGLILLSPAWLLAVYRANNDLVIFVLLAPTVWTLQRSNRIWRGVGAILVGAMAILKYYPVAAIIGLLRAARRREVVVLFAITAVVVALGWSSLGAAITAISRYGFLVTASVGLQAFGIKALPGALAPYAPPVVAWVAGVAALVAGYRLATENAPAPDSAERENRAMTAALFGAVLLGSFAIGTSYSYKLIFIWGLLPWLLQDAPAVLGRRRAGWLVTLLIVATWADGGVTTIVNALGPEWSKATRREALAFTHGFAIFSQLLYWVVMGAGARLAFDWSRRQWARLARHP